MNKQLEALYKDAVYFEKVKGYEKINACTLKSGQKITEVIIETDLGGQDVEIGVFTDVHFNFCNEQDLLDEELAGTFEKRTWNAGGASVVAAKKAQDITVNMDQTVIMGDILDYMSTGARDLTVEHIFSRNPNALCCIGGHDYTKQMQTDLPDKLPVENRLAFLKEFWPNDIHYDTKDVKNKVICVQLDNSAGHYLDLQVEKLKNDIQRAKNENKIILIFQHEPLSTGNPKDEALHAYPHMAASGSPRNLYSGDAIFSVNMEMTEADKKIYDLLKENTEVIKAIFAGHIHGVYYADINFDNGKTIPQYVFTSNCYGQYCGIVGRVTVK